MDTGMRRLLTGVMATALISTALAVPAATAAAFCTSEGALDVHSLPAEIDLRDCDLVGRTITDGPLQTRVPPPGQGLAVIAMAPGGEVRLEAATSPDGVVTITTAEPASDDAHDGREPAAEYSAAAAVDPADDFADAPIWQVPSSEQPAGGLIEVDRTLEKGEPKGCAPEATGSAWYRIRRKGSGQRIRLRADIPLAVYTGDSLRGLDRVKCIPPTQYDEQLVVMKPAKRYYVQALITYNGYQPQMWLRNGEDSPGSPAPCDVETHTLTPQITPRKPLKWRFNPADRPSGMSVRQTLRGVKRGVNIVTGSKNDCGMDDRVSARASYLGRSKKSAGACNFRFDGVNVVAFEPIGYASGIACIAWNTDAQGRRHVFESDMVLDKGSDWTLKPDRLGCQGEIDLVSVVAHETGHIFGLDHAEGRRGGNQTMASGDYCSGAHRTLGRGDIVGLRKLY